MQTGEELLMITASDAFNGTTRNPYKESNALHRAAVAIKEAMEIGDLHCDIAIDELPEVSLLRLREYLNDLGYGLTEHSHGLALRISWRHYG